VISAFYVPRDTTRAFVVTKHHVIPQPWYDLQGYGILEIWKIKFVLSTARINTILTEHICLLSLFYVYCYFTKLQAGREDLFLFWDGRGTVEQTTFSKTVEDEILSQTSQRLCTQHNCYGLSTHLMLFGSWNFRNNSWRIQPYDNGSIIVWYVFPEQLIASTSYFYNPSNSSSFDSPVSWHQFRCNEWLRNFLYGTQHVHRLGLQHDWKSA
jgi:hypothetical protein